MDDKKKSHSKYTSYIEKKTELDRLYSNSSFVKFSIWNSVDLHISAFCYTYMVTMLYTIAYILVVLNK